MLSLYLLTSIASGQQTYVGRYELYGGYMYLDSRLIKLGESGFHTQIGTNLKTWLALGFDFSTGTGDTALTPDMLKSSLRQMVLAKLAPLEAAGLLPANYALSVPLHSHSETFAMGPQLSLRHFSVVTIFVRPDLGAIHESAVLHPTDPIGKGLVAQLAPSGTKQDWTYFYGFGGGVDLNFSKHFSLRLQADFVRDHLFDDVLDARNSVRFSVGPSIHLGRNIVE